MSKKTLNQTNLESLGAAQLAALLMEVSTGSADIKRRLRLELSHNLGASELAHDVGKRLTSIRRSTSFVGWRRRKVLIKDLSTQVAMIVDKISPDDPTAAFDLLWSFVEMAPSVYGRVDDSKGDVAEVFRAAFTHFEKIGPRAVLDPIALADQVWAALQDNGYGEWDGVISALAPTLGRDGLAHLTQAVEAFAQNTPKDASGDHEAIQFLRQLRGGDDYAAKRKARFVQGCLQEIAAATGDTQAYIAQFSDEDLERQDIASEVALLLLEEGRADDALDLLKNAVPDGGDRGQSAWDAAYITTLDALGRREDAQARRWSCFEANLNRAHLRDYLKGLPDFEDIEAEDRARSYVLGFGDVTAALDFCLHWPDLVSAASLVQSRAGEIDGELYAVLAPAADALRGRYPLAAMVLWRVMINSALDRGLAFRYGQAADFLGDCASVDGDIKDYGDVVNHETYLQDLQTRHHRKSAFWAKAR